VVVLETAFKSLEDYPMIVVEQFDHLGIRVTDRTRALAFYAVLGFELTHESDFDAVVIIKNAAGVELNLILNGVNLTGGKNILMDVPEKHPGMTHVALRVGDIGQAIAILKANGIVITQGPVTFGDGHVSVFTRDPDRNVIELRARLDPAMAEKIDGLVFYDPKG
jgi:lactoylglutathione lyase